MAAKPKKLFARHIVRKIFLEDWAMKLTALVITFALWFGVTGLSTPTTKRFTVQLIPNLSNNAQITNTLIQDVDIVVSGDKRKIDQINKSDLSASLDLTDVAPGDRVISLTPDNISVPLPQGVKLVEIAPTRIAVNLEAVEEKEIEVKVVTTGTPAAGYDIYSSSSLPPKIKVRGPASIVKILDYVQTDAIDITDRKEAFTAKQIAVTSPNPKAAVLNTVVDVLFNIGEKRFERPFSLPISGLPGKTATFTVFGPRTLMQKLKADDIKVEMSLNLDGEEAPHVILPPSLQDVTEIRKLKVN
ncbi:MAG: CdaR family protein [Acidobacteriota bacterium]